MKKILTLLLIGSFLWASSAFAAVTKAVESVTDWNACPQNTIEESTVLDTSDHYGTDMNIQAFLDTTTAHTGTRFIVQVSSATSGDEDWHDYTEFVALIGTAATDLIEDNPLAASSTAITLTGHALTVEGIWLAIEDGTLINSELAFEASQTTNEVVVLDGTTNEHALSTAIFNVAMSKVVTIGFPVNRVRIICDNSYDADGSTLNYRIRATSVSGI